MLGWPRRGLARRCAGWAREGLREQLRERRRPVYTFRAQTEIQFLAEGERPNGRRWVRWAPVRWGPVVVPRDRQVVASVRSHEPSRGAVAQTVGYWRPGAAGRRGVGRSGQRGGGKPRGRGTGGGERDATKSAVLRQDHGQAQAFRLDVHYDSYQPLKPLEYVYYFIYDPPGSWLAGVRINGDSPGEQSQGGLPCGNR